MWILTTIGFFSVVAHRDRPGYVIVRSRVRADLLAFAKRLPETYGKNQPRRPAIIASPDADYAYRLIAPQGRVSELLCYLANEINYDNFKNAVARVQGKDRARVYGNVWLDLLQLQKDP